MEKNFDKVQIFDDEKIRGDLESIFGVSVQSLISHFKANGFVVIPNVLTPSEVKLCREGLHQDLLKLGVDYSNLSATCSKLKSIQSHQSGGLPFYFSPWRLKYCALNEPLFHFSRLMWKETYANNLLGYECPHAPFSTQIGYAYLDSMNFRIPTELAEADGERIQKSLNWHIDVDPWDKYGGKKGKTRWRPFQGFISLTDNVGGFECCPGFHVQMDDYFKKIPPPSESKGFIALMGKKYQPIINRFRPVEYKPGCAVLWDWRTPHKIADIHPGPNTREVVYTSFLPDIPINRNYLQGQLKSIREGTIPPDFQHRTSEVMKNEGQQYLGWDPDFFKKLTPLQEQLLGMKSF